jgi:hypothetical protein
MPNHQTGYRSSGRARSTRRLRPTSKVPLSIEFLSSTRALLAFLATLILIAGTSVGCLLIIQRFGPPKPATADSTAYSETTDNVIAAPATTSSLPIAPSNSPPHLLDAAATTARRDDQTSSSPGIDLIAVPSPLLDEVGDADASDPSYIKGQPVQPPADERDATIVVLPNANPQINDTRVSHPACILRDCLLQRNAHSSLALAPPSLPLQVTVFQFIWLLSPSCSTLVLWLLLRRYERRHKKAAAAAASIGISRSATPSSRSSSQLQAPPVEGETHADADAAVVVTSPLLHHPHPFRSHSSITALSIPGSPPPGRDLSSTPDSAARSDSAPLLTLQAASREEPPPAPPTLGLERLPEVPTTIAAALLQPMSPGQTSETEAEEKSQRDGHDQTAAAAPDGAGVIDIPPEQLYSVVGVRLSDWKPSISIDTHAAIAVLRSAPPEDTTDPTTRYPYLPFLGMPLPYLLLETRTRTSLELEAARSRQPWFERLGLGMLLATHLPRPTQVLRRWIFRTRYTKLSRWPPLAAFLVAAVALPTTIASIMALSQYIIASASGAQVSTRRVFLARWSGTRKMFSLSCLSCLFPPAQGWYDSSALTHIRSSLLLSPRTSSFWSICVGFLYEVCAGVWWDVIPISSSDWGNGLGFSGASWIILAFLEELGWSGGLFPLLYYNQRVRRISAAINRWWYARQSMASSADHEGEAVSTRNADEEEKSIDREDNIAPDGARASHLAASSSSATPPLPSASGEWVHLTCVCFLLGTVWSMWHWPFILLKQWMPIGVGYVPGTADTPLGQRTSDRERSVD